MAILVEPWRIPGEGRALEGAEPAEMLDLEPGSEIIPAGPVHYALRVQFVSGELVVEGSVEAQVEVRCSRCGERFRCTVREPALQAMLEVPNAHVPVDLTAEVREAILLAFPSYPLCRPDCRGLCARCGANLNRRSCRCATRAEVRWGPFDGL